jgi:hypothetical protein
MGKAKDAAKFVAPIFESNGWEWHNNGVPTEDDILGTIKSLKRSAKHVKGFAESGRLMARWNSDFKCVDYYLSLEGL